MLRHSRLKESVKMMENSYIASVLLMSSSVMVVSAVLTFLGLSFFAAPYGKYSSSKGWGPLVQAQLAWCFMEIPNLWVAALVYIFRSNTSEQAISSNVNKVALVCFLLHYVNRSIIYPFRMRSSQCTPMPISVMIAAFVFCAWNGLNQSVSLILIDKSSANITDLQSLAGVLIFLTGFYINVTSDSILINAKKSAHNGDTKSTKYVIPTGGMFKYVSCANYCKFARPECTESIVMFRSCTDEYVCLCTL